MATRSTSNAKKTEGASCKKENAKIPVHSDLARLDQESSSCSSIERSILHSIFRFRHDSSSCSCSSPEPLLRSMVRNDSFPSSCQTVGPVVQLVVELASTLNTCDRLGSSLIIRDACGDWGEGDAFKLRSGLLRGLF